jgi:hypothetical protein
LKNDNHVNPSYPINARLYFSSSTRRPYGNSRRRRASGVLLCAAAALPVVGGQFSSCMIHSEYLEQNMGFQKRYLVALRRHVLTPSAFLWKI